MQGLIKPCTNEKVNPYSSFEMRNIDYKFGHFRYTTDKYTTLQIIPHSSNRNYNSTALLKIVSGFRQNLFRSIYTIGDERVLKTTKKCTYNIYISKEYIGFYLTCPKDIVPMLKEKLRDIWASSVIKEEVNIPKLDNFSNCITNNLYYRYEDAMSLSIDKRSNKLLNSLLNVYDTLEYGDQIVIHYNLLPYYRSNWSTYCKLMQEKVLHGEPINKHFAVSNVLSEVIDIIIDIPTMILDTIFDEESSGSLFGRTKKTDSSSLSSSLSFKEMIATREEKLSKSTIEKTGSDIIQVQALVIATSKDKRRAENNAHFVCQSYREIDGDNEIDYKRVKPVDLGLFKYQGVESMYMSIDECQNLIQVPGKELLTKYKFIEHGNITETVLPTEITKGYMRIGKNSYKGDKIQTYMNTTDLDAASLPYVIVGPMGVGKSYQNKQFMKDAVAHGDGVIIPDYIKRCELADYLISILPKDKRVVIDLSDEKGLQSLAFNEYRLDKHSAFKTVESANLHQQEILSLVNAINSDEPLTGQMRKFLSSAANVVLLNDNQSLKDIIDCLEDADRRSYYIKNVSKDIYPYVREDIEVLKQLDEVKDDKVFTKYSKIEHIISRINLLREDVRTRLMFNKPASQNIDFVEAMKKGKSIIIKMPSNKFRSESVRNILVTFFISKVWLACNMIGAELKEGEEPHLYHMFLDEIFQAPTSYATLSSILRQCRKFRLQMIFTAHLLKDLGVLNEGLKSAGASYLLLQKCDKANYSFLKEEIECNGFSFDDLLHLKKRHSLNVIHGNDVTAVYEADLTC